MYKYAIPKTNIGLEPVYDNIKTLEGVSASFPFGGSSGEWGDSHKSFTEQHGTPIGADITYYAKYEDTFYHLDVDFPVETMKDLTSRFYATHEDLNNDEDLKEYVHECKPTQNGAYTEFRDLIFGFAPKGMVVVWLRYGASQIELGHYQAQVVKNDKVLEDKLFSSTITVSREQIRSTRLIPDANPAKWDNYRIKYFWKSAITSENANFKLFWVLTDYFNAEFENAVRPILFHPTTRERAVPSMISFFWETGKGQKYEGRAFFDWQKTNEQFKKDDNGDNQIQIKVNPNNQDFEVLLNNRPLETINKRIFKTDWEFKDSYK